MSHSGKGIRRWRKEMWQEFKGARVALDMCGTKIRYKTKEDARSARTRQEERWDTLTLRIYKCPFCRDFHLTSKPRHKK